MKLIPQPFSSISEAVSLSRLICKMAALLGTILVFQAGISTVRAQTGGASSQGPTLQQLFDAAQTYQSAGNLSAAAERYKEFLAEALYEIAHGYAEAGEFAKAQPFFEEALALTPENMDIQLDYASAADAAKDFESAKTTALEVLKAAPRNAKAHLVMGRILLHTNQDALAKRELEAAVAFEPNFENGYALAAAYLALKDQPSAEKIFAEMIAGFGDTAEIHLSFGKAYADASLPEQAIVEFKKAVALNDRLPTAHYCLGAAYLQSMGEIDDPQAAAEFRRELQINPDDFLSHYELGSIELTDHDLQNAESELTRAESLNPESPDPPLQLGEVYRQMNRVADAEAELRKSIALTHDASRNHYQVQRAYYMLGRLLLVNGNAEEGKKAIEESDRLLQASVRENQGKGGGLSNSEQAGAVAPKITALSGAAAPQARARLEAFEEQLRPAIADSFDNLGAIMAGQKNFAEALQDFREASEWNPSLEGLDYNWGRAAYSANDYAQAVGPLERYRQTHPNDTWVLTALGVSYYKLGKCADALHAFEPVRAAVDADAQAALAYAACQTKTGNASDGIARLKELARDTPSDPAVHEALGDALVSQQDLAGAAAEYRAALKSDPGNADAEFGLASALIALGRKIEARRLLGELVAARSKNPGVYSELGKLQLDSGEVKAAIVTLAAGEKVIPENAAIHMQLAAAYRKDSRSADAAREKKLYEALQSKRPDASDPAKQN